MEKEPSYTVNSCEGCKVVRGDIGGRELSALLLSWSCSQRDMVVCALLTDKLGATLVAGPRVAIMQWREKLKIGQ